MKEFQVRIREVLEREVSVMADSMAQAKEIAERGYRNCEHVLDASDFKGVTFSPLYPRDRGGR